MKTLNLPFKIGLVLTLAGPLWIIFCLASHDELWLDAHDWILFASMAVSSVGVTMVCVASLKKQFEPPK